MTSHDSDNTTDTARLKQRFDQSVDALDAHTASRITRIRYRALEKLVNKQRPGFLVPATAVASACILALVLMLSPREPDDAVIGENDIELISSSEDLEFYEELEFYEWLEGYELPS